MRKVAVRYAIALLSALILLGGCASGASSYLDAAEIVGDLRDKGIACEGLLDAETGRLVRAHARCEIEGDPVEIYMFTDEVTRDQWLNVGAGLGDVVVGPDWAIVAGPHSRDIAEALGAEIV